MGMTYLYINRELVAPINFICWFIIVISIIIIIIWLIQGYRIEREVGCVRDLLERIVEEQEDIDYAEYKKKMGGDKDAS